MERRAQPRQSKLVMFRAGCAETVPDKARRTADHNRAGQHGPGECLRLLRRIDQPGDDETNEVFQREAAVENVRRGKIRIGEIGFHRLDKPALAPSLQIGIHRRRTGERMRAAIGIALVFVEIKDRAERIEAPVCMAHGHQPRRAGRWRDSQCAVGGPEIETDKTSGHEDASYPFGKAVRGRHGDTSEGERGLGTKGPREI